MALIPLFSEIKLGDVGFDTVTMLRGTITAKIERATGDHQVLLEALDASGRPIEHWLQINRLSIVEVDNDAD